MEELEERIKHSRSIFFFLSFFPFSWMMICTFHNSEILPKDGRSRFENQERFLQLRKAVAIQSFKFESHRSQLRLKKNAVIGSFEVEDDYHFSRLKNASRTRRSKFGNQPSFVRLRKINAIRSFEFQKSLE